MQIVNELSSQLQSLLFTAPVVLLAVICHECAHGWVSYQFGDPTAKNAGRLTLNPLKHLDPIGTLCMLFFHVGWAKPVPINPTYYQNRRKGILCVSLAGPAANFILAFLSLYIEAIVLKFTDDTSMVIWIICQLCTYSARVNIGLGLFNLIPIPPLDGSNALGSVWKKAAGFYYKFRKYWRWILVIGIISGLFSLPLGWLNSLIVEIIWKAVTFMVRFGIV